MPSTSTSGRNVPGGLVVDRGSRRSDRWPWASPCRRRPEARAGRATRCCRRRRHRACRPSPQRVAGRRVEEPELTASEGPGDAGQPLAVRRVGDLPDLVPVEPGDGLDRAVRGDRRQPVRARAHSAGEVLAEGRRGRDDHRRAGHRCRRRLSVGPRLVAREHDEGHGADERDRRRDDGDDQPGRRVSARLARACRRRARARRRGDRRLRRRDRATAAPQPWQKRASSSLARPQVGQLLAKSPPGMVSRVVDRHRIRWTARGTGVSPW